MEFSIYKGQLYDIQGVFWKHWSPIIAFTWFLQLLHSAFSEGSNDSTQILESFLSFIHKFKATMQ
jgi:hypothetical protein